MAELDLPSLQDEDIARRFRHAGVIVPADRVAGAHAAAQRLLATLHFIRSPRGAAAEPAHIFLPGKSAE